MEVAQTQTAAPGQPDVRSHAHDSAPASPGVVARPRNGYRFTDARGRVAYLWWESTGPVVESEDAALRRRVLRALKQPIWIVEDEPDEFGVQWSTRKHIHPEDPRYAGHWFWSLGQVGLGNLAKADIVRRDTKQRVWPPWDEATDHLTEQY